MAHHFPRLMDFNDIRKAELEGRLLAYDLPTLRDMRQVCVLVQQSGQLSRESAHTLDSIDKEIHRKEQAETEQRSADRDLVKIETIQKLDGKVSAVDGRLAKLEHTASRPVLKKWEFWLGVAAILISLLALFRDYLGWTLSTPASVSAPSSAPMLNAPQPTRSVVLPAPVIAPPPPIATNQLGSNSQPPQVAPPP